MKKLITLLLVLGFSMPVMAEGENGDEKVKCEDIFQGNAPKAVGTAEPDTTEGDKKVKQQ